MGSQKKQILWNVLCFLLLFSVSLYRQISLRLWPGDHWRSWILYGCYVLLLGMWAWSILSRTAQRWMRICLLAEDALMLVGLTLRFLQDTFWTDNLLLTRVSGLWVGATLLPLAFLGLGASLGTGRSDEYKPPKAWYWLAAPLLVMVWLLVTDEQRHFVCYIVPSEPQPNLIFHPYIGTFLIAGIIGALVLARVLVIYRRNRSFAPGALPRWLVPLFEPLLLLVFSFPFFVVSMDLIPALAGKEVLEFYAKLYYIEVLSWEFYIYIGLVPVNTEYRAVFAHSTVGMQILSRDGSLLRSEKARPVSKGELEQLRQEGTIRTQDGQELRLTRLKDGEFLYNQDLSLLLQTIEALNQNAETLAQEGELLAEELRTRNRESAVHAKNRIYDALTREAAPQLERMKELLNREDPESLEEIYLLGTWIKRRCNLRLIQGQSGLLSSEDLRLSLLDLEKALARHGIEAQLALPETLLPDRGHAITLYDLLGSILRAADCKLQSLTLRDSEDGLNLQVRGSREQLTALKRLAACSWQEIPGGLLLPLGMGGTGNGK